jgi:EAL domain-containing protein (putative c-di-GMP-specific phosphodiesterase class I)
MIEDVESSQRAEALVKTCAYLANNTSMQLIVAGVQSTEQKNLLQTLGCHLMQGHLFGLPLTEQEVTNKMAERLPGI